MPEEATIVLHMFSIVTFLSATNALRALPAVSRCMRRSLAVDVCRSWVARGLLWSAAPADAPPARDIESIGSIDELASAHLQLESFFLQALREGWGREEITTLTGVTQSSRHASACARFTCPSAGLAERALDSRSLGPLTLVTRRGAASTAERHVRWLLAWRADANERDGTGRTPLTWAAQRLDVATCQTLLEARADIHFKDRYGSTALSIARRFNRREMVEMLVAASDAALVVPACR